MGETAALITAVCWAVAARMFQVLGSSFSPLALNFWKGLLAMGLLLIITQWFMPPVNLPVSAYGWLILSGIIGIGLGDTFFFKSLNKIGDSQALLIAETMGPILTALLAMAWIAEWLSWAQWLGIAIIILSVDVIIKLQKRTQMHLFAPSGYVFAALAALCQSVGAVISRDILTRYELDAFNASQIRLAGGMVVIVALMLLLRQNWLPKTANSARLWRYFFLATAVGTFAALYLQMVSFTYTKAAIAETLFATSVIISLLVGLVLGERVSKKVWIWSFVALSGVGILVAT
ncbi:DMT family transporter [Alteromonas sp. MYP5]|uniref:DMT family transporter n=2 Tax=Alteromonas ponticola TaxID=2720613 RepID=A0ABX1R559_9ALTE|nr:DMT family transporter [Alteromonas ponticola]NMH60893.1 DMT family transporter [Alteromonas ponticola]